MASILNSFIFARSFYQTTGLLRYKIKTQLFQLIQKAQDCIMCLTIKGEECQAMNKILIADDAAFMRMLIKDTLIKSGYTNIIEAADGESACTLYDAERPSLVFMDITMPNKNGLETLADIKKVDPTANVVMCSAMGQEAVVLDAIKLGARDFIVKPFKAERLLQVVRKILG